jgi:hypothetical protein
VSTRPVSLNRVGQIRASFAIGFNLVISVLYNLASAPAAYACFVHVRYLPRIPQYGNALLLASSEKDKGAAATTHICFRV